MSLTELFARATLAPESTAQALPGAADGRSKISVTVKMVDGMKILEPVLGFKFLIM